MPMIPELPIAMLGCARLGITHSVVFGGFSAEALKVRILDLAAAVVITADGGWRRGKEVLLKKVVDDALTDCPGVKDCIVFQRTNSEVSMTEGRDHYWSDLDTGLSEECPAEELDSEHPLYVLYTSGTTGQPKGIVHTTGGYQVQVRATLDWVFDIKDEDTYWCAADIGWVTGHSYIVYGPLLAGATTVMYEGAPDFPQPDRFWRIIEKYRVNVFYTSPTAIRAFIKFGDPVARRTRPVEPAAARLGRRTHQPLGLGVVSPRDRGRNKLPDCRHLVADRNRLDHALADAGSDTDQTRVSDLPPAGHRGRRR